MRHIPDGTLRRLVDEPFAVPDGDAAHAVACPRCAKRQAQIAQDAATVTGLLVRPQSVPDLDIAWNRLQAASFAPALPWPKLRRSKGPAFWRWRLVTVRVPPPAVLATRRRRLGRCRRGCHAHHRARALGPRARGVVAGQHQSARGRRGHRPVRSSRGLRQVVRVSQPALRRSGLVIVGACPARRVGQRGGAGNGNRPPGAICDARRCRQPDDHPRATGGDSDDPTRHGRRSPRRAVAHRHGRTGGARRVRRFQLGDRPSNPCHLCHGQAAVVIGGRDHG